MFIQTLPQRQLFTAERSCTSVYWAKDDHIAGARLYGWDPKRLGRKERRLATSADLVIVCSDALADRWRSEGVEAAVLHNGVDVNHFERSAIAREDSAITADHTIIYIGTVTSRVDADLILKVADAGHPVTLVGGVRATQEWDDFALLHQHQRVRMVGPRSYDELPDYLAAASVGIVPYKVDRYNIGSFPLKILEYLAAGLPVVSTDLPAARQFEGRHVTVATTAEEFVQAVGSASRSGFSKSTVAARRGIAKENDWNKRADQFLRLLGLP